MTNKTITLALDQLRRWVGLLDTPPRRQELLEELRAALADPVPPTGGEPGVKRYSLMQIRYDSHDADIAFVEAKHFDENAAHVTRLQAEVETLREALRTEVEAGDSWKREAEDRKRKHLRSCQIAIGKSQLAKERHAELTKARELICDLRADTQSGYLKAVQALHNWANQSAPADKGD